MDEGRLMELGTLFEDSLSEGAATTPEGRLALRSYFNEAWDIATNALRELAGCRDEVTQLRQALEPAERLAEVAEDFLREEYPNGTDHQADHEAARLARALAEYRAALASPPRLLEHPQENRYAFYRAAWKDAETRADQHLDLALRNLRRAQAAEARADTQENA